MAAANMNNNNESSASETETEDEEEIGMEEKMENEIIGIILS